MIDLAPAGRPAWVRYGLAVVLVVSALVLKLAFPESLGRSTPFLLFPFATMAAAWLGGFGPGALATVLSVTLTALFFLDPPFAQPASATLRLTAATLQGLGISWMAYKLRRSTDQSRDASELALNVLDNLEDAFFVVDRQWRFLFVSRSFAARYPLRLPLPEIVGKGLWDVYPELLGTVIEQKYREAMEKGATIRFETRSVISDRWFQISAIPMPEGLAVYSNDLSDRKRAEEDLQAAKNEAEARNRQLQELAREAQRARDEAESANRLKDQFLAILSHELRTPLNAILGWAQLLRNQPEGMGLTRGLEAIERNARAQTQLIEDLLDISRINSGLLRLDLRPLDPAEALETAVGTVLPAAQAKHLRIERRYEPGSGPVLGDPGRLQQIFANLLSNAVKFTPNEGRVEVIVERAGEEAVVRIRDSGQGIAPEFLPYVFESFRQADASTTRRQGGLGLGLSIVRQLVELQGGRVEASSPGLGQGATFTVAFPLAAQSWAGQGDPSNDGDASREEALSGRLPLAGVRILAVDDERDTLEMMCELLSLRGAEVRSAASADEALGTLQEFQPDVLVSDISMPGRDGYDFIREVRSRGQSAEILPAVAVTALASPEDRRRALAAGYQVHIGKPVDPNHLTATLKALSEKRVS